MKTVSKLVISSLLLLGGVMALAVVVFLILFAFMFIVVYGFTLTLTQKPVLIMYLVLSMLFIGWGMFHALKMKDKKLSWGWWLYFGMAFGFFVNFFGRQLEYRSYINLKPDVSYFLVDKPRGINAIHKNMKVYAEVGGDNYEIMGWRDNKRLIYEKEGVSYQFDVETQKSQLIDMEVSVGEQRCKFDDCLSALVLSDPGAFVLQPIYNSPDGKYVAFIVYHIYGPGDIIIADTTSVE